MNGQVLVTGAAGFAGSHLIELLRQDGDRARRVAPPRAPPLPPMSPAFAGTAVDLLDAGGREPRHGRPAARRGLSLSPGRRTSASPGAACVRRSRSTSSGLTTCFARWPAPGWRRASLIPGSALVYRQSDAALSEEAPLGPASPYALSKLAQEMLGIRAIAEDGQRVVVARSFNHLGPRQDPSFAASSFARQIARIEAGMAEPIIEVGNLDARRDLTDVRDMVRAYHVILQRGRPGAVYNVCSGRAHVMGDVLERLVRLSRVAVEIRRDAARCRPQDLPLLLGDPERITRDLGWTPRITLEQSLADLLAYWRETVL